MAKANSVKGREILNSKEKFPDFSLPDYDISLARNLNFYNIEIEDFKRKKEWAIKHWQDEKKDTTGFSKLSDGFFATVGAVAHMVKYRHIILNPRDSTYLDRKYLELKKLASLEIEEDVQKLISREERVDAEFKVHMAEFEFGIDTFFNDTKFDGKSYLLKHAVNAGITKRIADALKPKLKELVLAASETDEDLSEGYSNLSKRQLNKYITHIQSLIDSCDSAAAITKATRKPRKLKLKAPSEVVKNVKYLKEDVNSKLKSEHPSNIIKSNEVWVYNAKNRRLFRYVALGGMKLSVKGATIINIDPEKSSGKIIRKPEVLLTGIQNLTSRPLNKLYNDIRGSETHATGRLNEETLIVKCIH